MAVVAGEDDASGAAYGYPAGCFERLCRLVDEERRELLAFQHAVGGAGEGACHDARFAEQRGAYAQLYLRGATLQAVHLLMPCVRPASLAAQFSDGFAYAPELRIVGVRLEAACWIAIRRAGRVIFAGDHCQLPPTVKSIMALKGGLGITLMERIVKAKPDD